MTKRRPHDPPALDTVLRTHRGDVPDVIDEGGVYVKRQYDNRRAKQHWKHGAIGYADSVAATDFVRRYLPDADGLGTHEVAMAHAIAALPRQEALLRLWQDREAAFKANGTARRGHLLTQVERVVAVADQGVDAAMAVWLEVAQLPRRKKGVSS